MIFFTSDTHFGHENIIKYTNRPFTDRVDMDEGLIARWNSVVSPVDIVFHLGDFSFYSQKAKVQAILQQLNGTIFLVPGNHDYDPWHKWRPHDFEELGHWKVLPKLYELEHNGELWVMCHYPLEAWNHANRRTNSFHVHGHTHGSSRPIEKRLDVGVDFVGMEPISLDKARETMLQSTHMPKTYGQD